MVTLMYRLLFILILSIYSFSSIASVNINRACEEKEEQKMSLTKFSTSLGEAFLAGQCIGYESLHRVNIHKSCIEFIEQKKALLSSLSTSLKEATLSGMCVGAIYRIVEECTTRYNYINYLDIAENAYSIGYVQDYLNCNGNKYDW